MMNEDRFEISDLRFEISDGGSFIVRHSAFVNRLAGEIR
jgi:hypothetical protein